ncbi:unnamed protein product [Urochloa humidicola]
MNVCRSRHHRSYELTADVPRLTRVARRPPAWARGVRAAMGLHCIPQSLAPHQRVPSRAAGCLPRTGEGRCAKRRGQQLAVSQQHGGACGEDRRAAAGGEAEDEKASIDSIPF